MKSCPSCKQEVFRLKKGGCPQCGVPLFLLKGKYRRTSDRDLVRQFLLRLDAVYAEVRNLQGVQVYSKDSGAWGGAYHLLDLTNIFMASQVDTYGMGAANLFFDTLELVIQEQWWKEHLGSVYMLYNKWNKTMPQVILNYRRVHTQTTIQTRKVENANGRPALESRLPVF